MASEKSLEAAKRIVDNLNDRSGIYIDFDEDIMEGIYLEIANEIESVNSGR